MIGSHNSLSYLPPRNLWGKITKLWGKCQDKTLVEQYNAGVRYFDIRLNLYRNCIGEFEWHFVHNKVDYGLVDCSLWKYLGGINASVRVIYDQRIKPEDAENKTNRFLTYLYIIKDKYNVNIDSAITFWDWKEHYKPTIEVKEYHASVSTKWYQYILGTKWFSKHYNRRNIAINAYNAVHDYKVLLLDYIEYGNE